MLLAGVGYLLSWVVGLALFASSTEVRSTGDQVMQAYAGQTGLVIAQFVLTEGAAGLLLAVVLWRLGVVTGGRLGRVIALTGLTAAAISIAQCAIGIVLATSVLSRQDAHAASAAYNLLTRLDGVKMLLLAVTAGATALGIRRPRAPLPSVLGVVAAATAIALAVSGVGYLALEDALARAAYISLPLLILFVTGSAVCLSRANRATGTAVRARAARSRDGSDAGEPVEQGRDREDDGHRGEGADEDRVAGEVDRPTVADGIREDVLRLHFLPEGWWTTPLLLGPTSTRAISTIGVILTRGSGRVRLDSGPAGQ